MVYDPRLERMVSRRLGRQDKIREELDPKIYHRIVGRIEAGKLPIYPTLIRKKAVKQYKAEKQAEIKRKQAETEVKIQIETQRRAEAQAAALKEWSEGQKAITQVKPGGWVKINTDGSVSKAGFAAYSPSEAKALGFKWGTTLRKYDETGFSTTTFIPLPKPTEAEFYGVRKWKLEKGQYAHDPALEKRVRKEVEIGGKKYDITAPAWAGGYLKEYERAAKAIKHSYQEAVRSMKTPSGHELKEITLGKEGLGFRYAKRDLPPETMVHRDTEKQKKVWKSSEEAAYRGIMGKARETARRAAERQTGLKRDIDKPGYMEVQKGFVRPTPYAPKKSDYAIAESIPLGKSVMHKPSPLPSPTTIPLTAAQAVPLKVIGSIVDKIKDVGVYSTTFGYVKPSEKPLIIPSKKPSKFEDILFKPTKIHLKAHYGAYEETIKRIEKEESIAWKGIEPQRMFIGSAIQKGEHVGGDVIKTLEKGEIQVEKIPGVKQWQIITKRLSEPTFGLSTWFEPTAPIKFVKSFKEGYTKTKKSHPLEDIKKGEEWSQRHITTPVYETIAGEKAVARREQQEKASESYKVAEGLVKPGWIQPSGELLLPTRLKSEVTEVKDTITNLDQFGRSRGWQKPDGSFEYPDTTEGKDWAKKYDTALDKQKKYLTSHGYYKQDFVEYVPEAQEYLDAYKTYEKEEGKTKKLPKPTPVRQFFGGVGEFAAGLPGFFVFSAPHIIAQTAIKPSAAPGKLVGFGKGFYEFGKTEPFRAAGSITAMALGGKAIKVAKAKTYNIPVRLRGVKPFVGEPSILGKIVGKKYHPTVSARPLAKAELEAGIFEKELPYYHGTSQSFLETIKKGGVFEVSPKAVVTDIESSLFFSAPRRPYISFVAPTKTVRVKIGSIKDISGLKDYVSKDVKPSTKVEIPHDIYAKAVLKSVKKPSSKLTTLIERQRAIEKQIGEEVLPRTKTELRGQQEYVQQLIHQQAIKESAIKTKVFEAPGSFLEWKTTPMKPSTRLTKMSLELEKLIIKMERGTKTERAKAAKYRDFLDSTRWEWRFKRAIPKYGKAKEAVKTKVKEIMTEKDLGRMDYLKGEIKGVGLKEVEKAAKEGKAAVPPKAIAGQYWKGVGEMEYTAAPGTKFYPVESLRGRMFGIFGIEKGKYRIYDPMSQRWVEVLGITEKVPKKAIKAKKPIVDFGDFFKKITDKKSKELSLKEHKTIAKLKTEIEGAYKKGDMTKASRLEGKISRIKYAPREPSVRPLSFSIGRVVREPIVRERPRRVMIPERSFRIPERREGRYQERVKGRETIRDIERQQREFDRIIERIVGRRRPKREERRDKRPEKRERPRMEERGERIPERERQRIPRRPEMGREEIPTREWIPERPEIPTIPSILVPIKHVKSPKKIIKPTKDKKLKPRRKPFGAYQLDLTNPILTPTKLLEIMGGMKK